MADMTQSGISDDTMANLPTQLLSENVTHIDETIDASQDMFDTTVTCPTTSNEERTDAQHRGHIKKAELCIEGCKHTDGKGKHIGPVQCHLCQHWIHPPCIGEIDKDIINTWTCPTCRKLPDMMTYMLAMVISIQKENRLLKTQVTQGFSSIQDKLDEHCQLCTRKDDTTQKTIEALNTRHNELMAAASEKEAELRQKVTELTNNLSSQT